jgi:hypothetical protein
VRSTSSNSIVASWRRAKRSDLDDIHQISTVVYAGVLRGEAPASRRIASTISRAIRDPSPNPRHIRRNATLEGKGEILNSGRQRGSKRDLTSICCRVPRSCTAQRYRGLNEALNETSMIDYAKQLAVN